MSSAFIKSVWFLVVLLATSLAWAAKPTWAKKATAFPGQCVEESEFRSCKQITIPSPDGSCRVEVFYRKKVVGNASILQAYLRLTTPTREAREAEVPDGFQNVDLLWSPDSKAFFINGGNGGAYWGFWVYLFLTDAGQFGAIDVVQPVQRDMVKTFPPCRAARMDRRTCKGTERDPEYNVSGIDWVGPNAILVMAEVPCAGSYGGIMCQIMGYELEVPSGRLLKRIDAKELKRDWQKSMAWRFRVPDAPIYRRSGK